MDYPEQNDTRQTLAYAVFAAVRQGCLTLFLGVFGAKTFSISAGSKAHAMGTALTQSTINHLFTYRPKRTGASLI